MPQWRRDALFSAVAYDDAPALCHEIELILQSYPAHSTICFGDLVDGRGYTLLARASQLECPSIARMLLHPPMRPDLERSSEGVTPLVVASLGGNTLTAKALLDAGASPLHRVFRNGRFTTPFDIARSKGHRDLAALLARAAWSSLADAELGGQAACADDDERAARLTVALDTDSGNVVVRALLSVYKQGIGADETPLMRALIHGKQCRLAELLELLELLEPLSDSAPSAPAAPAAPAAPTWLVPDAEDCVPTAPPLPPSPPHEYMCPLSMDWLEDPVTAPSGYSYSRKWIEQHLRSMQTDPVTREPLSRRKLYPNRALRDAVERARAAAEAAVTLPCSR